MKNHLPPELGAAFRTFKQWAAIGYLPEDGAEPVQMHPSMMAKRLYAYYHKTQVVDSESLHPDESPGYRKTEGRIAAELKKSTGHGGLTAAGCHHLFKRAR